MAAQSCNCDPQVLNAIKYSTAFPVIIFSAMKYQVSSSAWVSLYKPLWLGAALLNSSYSYFWDIERDWEIQFFTSPGAHLLPASTGLSCIAAGQCQRLNQCCRGL